MPSNRSKVPPSPTAKTSLLEAPQTLRNVPAGDGAHQHQSPVLGARRPTNPPSPTAQTSFSGPIHTPYRSKPAGRVAKVSGQPGKVQLLAPLSGVSQVPASATAPPPPLPPSPGPGPASVCEPRPSPREHAAAAAASAITPATQNLTKRPGP